MAINKNYLQLEFGSGNFFMYSSTEKDGFEKHTSSKGNVSYRKYFKEGISGVLESVSLYDGKFGQQISMNIKNGDEVYFVPVDIYDQRGNVDTYAESLIKLLPRLEKGQSVVVRGYNFTPEGEQHAKIGVSITADGEKLKGALTNSYYNKDKELVPGDIPAIVWVEKLGKKKPSAVSLEAKDDYLLGVVTKNTERLKFVKSSDNTTQEAPAAKKEQQKPVQESIIEDEDDDDMPF